MKVKVNKGFVTTIRDHNIHYSSQKNVILVILVDIYADEIQNWQTALLICFRSNVHVLINHTFYMISCIVSLFFKLFLNFVKVFLALELIQRLQTMIKVYVSHVEMRSIWTWVHMVHIPTTTQTYTLEQASDCVIVWCYCIFFIVYIVHSDSKYFADAVYVFFPPHAAAPNLATTSGSLGSAAANHSARLSDSQARSWKHSSVSWVWMCCGRRSKRK